jgi:hypothetical protein
VLKTDENLEPQALRHAAQLDVTASRAGEARVIDGGVRNHKHDRVSAPDPLNATG